MVGFGESQAVIPTLIQLRHRNELSVKQDGSWSVFKYALEKAVEVSLPSELLWNLGTSARVVIITDC